jgi:DUF1680 family protein
LPFAHQSEFTGHAVRHLYYTCGAADAYAETGRADWMDALQALWSNLTAKRMFVTGGAGSRYEGEAFGADYELPNDRAYTETCAAIASVMWNWRMLNITGEARFADLMELTLYNAVLPGLSLDGAHYFYQNPLADRGTHRRQEWFGCACCPPNVARTLASIAGYFASVDDDGGVYLHMYAAGTVTVPSPAGGSVSLDVRTEYPWDGNITITITDNSSGARSMYLRVPAWAANAHIEVNGMPSAAAPRTYAQIPMPAAGSSIKLVLPMPIERVESHPHVLGNLGRVTLRRGPLVYCIEQADHPDGDVWNIALPDDATLTPEYRPGLLGGVTVLRGQAVVQDIEADAPLYRIAGQRRPLRPVELTAIPYYAWANREPGAMAVWMPRRAVIVEAAPTPRSSSL